MSGRLPPIDGEWIDRAIPCRFEFDGSRYEGFAGDVPVSALWAAGVRVLGRSFKYHRPRGLLSFANHDVNTLMQAGARLNLRADVEPLENGMVLSAVNTAGNAASDRLRFFDLLSPILPVGFYYKAFHRPRALAPFWERVFRRVTGLGRLDTATPRIRTPKRYDHADVLVIGGGPAGLHAALRAGATGARVVLVDENARVGGSLHYQRGGSRRNLDRLRALEAEVSRMSNVSVRAGTFAAGWYTDNWVPLVDATRMTKLRAKAIVVAQGVFEQPAVFRNNDLPGVMLASAAQRLIYRHAVRPMRVAIVLTANDDGYRAALDLAAHGVTVAGVVDMRHDADGGDAESALLSQGIRILKGACVFEAEGHAGHLVAARVCPLDRYGHAESSRPQRIACDGIVMSVGWAPAAALLYQSGARMVYDTAVEQFVPSELPPGVFAAGRVNGVHDLDARCRDGERAGALAAAHAGHGPTGDIPGMPVRDHNPNHPYPVVEHPAGKNFVDFDEDLQAKDFFNAAQEGFDNIELLKRFTTVGMGPSQGKHSSMTAIRILARIRGQSPGEVGSTTARPFFHPVPMSHLAGRGFMPRRETPLHGRHAALGAIWMQAGLWSRPEYYGAAGRDKSSLVREEVRAVRTGVGLIDVGTLGKIELRGPDAVHLLERVYTGKFAGLKVGMTRYGVMLDESAVVIDDGVIARLGEAHFYFTTTTTGSTAVYRELQRRIAEWGLEVGIVNVTGAFAAVNLAGPLARRTLAGLTTLDLGGARFPYLAVREGEVAGIPVRLMRVGFVGESGYEIHVPAEFAGTLWDALMDAGRSHGIRPFGVEAQRALRLEKGHLIIGQDTDGLTTPDEAGLGWAVKMDKPFFVGKRSLEIIRRRGPRQQLVGFELASDAPAVPKECHLVVRDGQMAGRVTSILESESLNRTIGLAYVSPDMTATGTALAIRADNGIMVNARVVPTPFYDPEGRRQEQPDE